jgi:PBP1b-binding outer membrane lipoprotein LpoB
MKKSMIALVLVAAMLSSSCATILGGPVSASQKRKPKPGEPQREVRVLALIADLILFAPGTIVDFATGAIYKPEVSRALIEIKINQ